MENTDTNYDEMSLSYKRGEGEMSEVNISRFVDTTLKAWDKILKDSEQRNKIFFKKLGLI